MRWKEIAVTVLICVLLIAGGAWGFSLSYQAFFHPQAIIEGHPANLTGWQDAWAQYEKEILYPFPSLLEEGIIAETDGMYLLSDDYHINPSLYSSVLGLAGLAWADLEDRPAAAYGFQSGTTEYDEYGERFLFHITSAGKDGQQDLVLVVNEEGMPVLFQYGRSDKGGSMDRGDILCSPVAIQGLPAGTEDYLARLDAVLGTEMSYRLLMAAIAGGMRYEGELPEMTLAQCSRYGEWNVYSDASTAAYVCIINDYHFILYHDIASGGFCGYSIALNPSE